MVEGVKHVEKKTKKRELKKKHVEEGVDQQKEEKEYIQFCKTKKY